MKTQITMKWNHHVDTVPLKTSWQVSAVSALELNTCAGVSPKHQSSVLDK